MTGVFTLLAGLGREKLREAGLSPGAALDILRPERERLLSPSSAPLMGRGVVRGARGMGVADVEGNGRDGRMGGGDGPSCRSRSIEKLLMAEEEDILAGVGDAPGARTVQGK